MKFAGLLGAVLLFGTNVTAHEFWLEPEKYQLESGEKIVAKALNGENFVGTEYSYTPRGYARSGVVAGDAKAEIPGKSGQRPAVQVQPPADGLNVVYHASAASTVVYPTMEKFESFLRGKRLEAALAVHKERGYPTENIIEGYYRFVKALVASGSGDGADRAVGMPFELVALDNPYTSSGDIRFSLLFEGKPRADTPVYVFHRHNGAVQELFLRTNGSGQVTVPRMPGEFQVNAVLLMEAGAKMKAQLKATWQTLWAASVYEIAG